MSGPNTPKMLPKPARKASVSMRDAAAIAKAAQTAAMPPPPDPVPAQGILEAEMSALSHILASIECDGKSRSGVRVLCRYA